MMEQMLFVDGTTALQSQSEQNSATGFGTFLGFLAINGAVPYSTRWEMNAEDCRRFALRRMVYLGDLSDFSWPRVTQATYLPWSFVRAKMSTAGCREMPALLA
jgi:hypothetical protein